MFSRKIRLLSLLCGLLLAGGFFVLSRLNASPSAQSGKEEALSSVPLSQPLSAPFVVAAEPEIIPPVRLRAVGDIMLSRSVGTRIARSGDNTSPFLHTADFLAAADITMANLESPFSDQGAPIGDDGMVFKAAPDTIEGLLTAGFDVVSLANNHFGNAGRYGMTYSFDHLTARGIQYVGAGRNTIEAHALKIMEVRGYQIGFLGYNDIPPTGYEADADTPGSAWANADEMVLDITRARAENELDYLIVTPHWGVEYTPTPNIRQRELGYTAIDAGADMIIGHHPHVVQEVEWYGDNLIIYSLGNFVFDQMWSTETRQGVIADIVLTDTCAVDQGCHPERPSTVIPDADPGSLPVAEEGRLSLESIDFLPIRIHDYYQPDFITDEGEIAEILGRMKWEGM